MKNTLETRLGIFVALAVIAAVLILETLGGVDRFRRGDQLNALFNNVSELKVGDRVKVAGVEVGRVEKILLDKTNNLVRVVMKVRPHSGIKTDSQVSVRFTGLMGQNFVSVNFGSPDAPEATDGAVLNAEPTTDLNSMMKKIDAVATGVENITKSFTGDKIENLLGPFTDFLKANQAPLTATIANMSSISSQISQGKGTIGKLIYDDSLYNTASAAVTNLQGTLQDASAELKLTLADARKIVDQINSGQGTVGKLVKDDTLYRETTAAMSNAREILQKVNSGQGSIGKIVNDQDLYRNANMTMQKLDQATEGLEDQGPLSVLGLVVGKLF
jgi:phospholipid/cholesterol/gamma-HCH transport system substrate-binding protein